MSNPLLQPVAEGRIRNLADLKNAYRDLLKQTNPDGLDSATFIQKYLESNSHYEEAKAYLAQTGSDIAPSMETAGTNHRLEFYKQLHLIELIETQSASQTENNQVSINTTKELAIMALSKWKPGVADLWAKVDAELILNKKERQIALYIKHSLALSIRTLVDNIIAFHLSGNEDYARQSRLRSNSIMQKVAGRGWRSLYGFLTFIIEDMKNGAAAFD
jgi:hypothetical protein